MQKSWKECAGKDDLKWLLQGTDSFRIAVGIHECPLECIDSFHMATGRSILAECMVPSHQVPSSAAWLRRDARQHVIAGPELPIAWLARAAGGSICRRSWRVRVMTEGSPAPSPWPGSVLGSSSPASNLSPFVTVEKYRGCSPTYQARQNQSWPGEEQEGRLVIEWTGSWLHWFLPPIPGPLSLVICLLERGQLAGEGATLTTL